MPVTLPLDAARAVLDLLIDRIAAMTVVDREDHSTRSRLIEARRAVEHAIAHARR